LIVVAVVWIQLSHKLGRTEGAATVRPAQETAT
jgi:hypothetical protein